MPLAQCLCRSRTQVVPVAGGIPLKRPREVYQYTPPSPPNGHPLRLLTIFNSDDWQREVATRCFA